MTASAMSMPALTPDEVAERPSSTQRAWRTHSTRGPCSTTHWKNILLVVARRPSSRPARASSALPVQTDHRHLGLGRAAAQPLQHRFVLDLRAGAQAAWDQQQIERRTVGEAVLGDHGRALMAAHRSCLFGDRDDVHRSRHVAEHLQRPERVEQLEAGIEQRAEAPDAIAIAVAHADLPASSPRRQGCRAAMEPFAVIDRNDPQMAPERAAHVLGGRRSRSAPRPPRARGRRPREQRRAASRRARSTNFAGVTPVSPRNTRAKLRGLIAARAASASTERFPRRLATIHSGRRLQRAGRDCLGRQRAAELRLPARALEEHHQPARHRERHVVAEVVLDQRQRKVDAGGHTGRGVQRCRRGRRSASGSTVSRG